MNDSPQPARSAGLTARLAKTAATPVVGIGASAGGLEAFTLLLSHLRTHTGMAYVLIQHLDPGHESQLASILEQATEMPVREVTDGVHVEPDHVYVIPPNTSMTLLDGTLRLVPRHTTANSPHMPIDAFFRSLALDRQQGAIGVILSGTGSDGSLGLGEIKAGGGITFAQDEQSAKYPAMPLNALHSGAVDLVLTPEGIAEELARIGVHPYLRPSAPVVPPPPPTPPEEGYEKILTLLHRVTGVSFADYRDQTIRRRIARRMALHQQNTLAQYAEFLETNRPEVDNLFHDILINVTGFFRDPAVFEILKTRVFPEILKSKTPGAPIRIWVPGCSTGQEAYSLAIVLLEFLDQKVSHPPIQIFGTDLADAAAVERARVGMYSENITAEVSAERLQRFFTKEDRGYRIGRSVRDLCIFAKQNVAVDPPFSKVDLITCRNLLIYLAGPLQQRVIPMFHYALNPGGFLVLGASESIGRYTDLFHPVDAPHRVFVKSGLVTRPYPVLGAPTSMTPSPTPTDHGPIARSPNAADLQREADRLTLNRYAPAGVLVNDALEVLQFRGRTRDYLEPAPGEASLDLLRMARDHLYVALRRSIEQARLTGMTVRQDDVHFRDQDQSRVVNLEIIPLKAPGAAAGGFLIYFEEPVPPAGAKPPPAAPPPPTCASEIELLRQELADAREHLQAVTEQQSAANEELRSANEEVLSANEELQSTNEELQTAKEELQSTNEELVTVNEELQHRNAELSQLNDDLINLLASVKLPIVMLGTDLRVRRFTPAAGQILGLVATDIGQPLATLRLPLPLPALGQTILDVIANVTVKEQEIQDAHGHTYLLRVHPYRTGDHRIAGATLVLLDIQEMRQAQDALREARDYAMAIVETVPNPLLILDASLRVRTASHSFYQTFHVESGETIGRHVCDLGNGQWNQSRLRTALEAVLPQNSSFVDFEIEHDFPRIGRRTMLLAAQRIHTNNGPIPLVFLTIQDVTERKSLEHRLAERMAESLDANASKDHFLAALSHELRTPLTPVLMTASVLEARADLPADVREELGILRRNVGLEARLIDDLLDLTRIVRGKLTLDLRPQDLRELLEQTVRICQPDVAAKQLRLTVNDQAAHHAILADGPRFQQVLWNLLKNAIKFTPSGGLITVRLTHDTPDRLAVHVIDTGMGIDPEVLPKLFEAFQQGPRHITHRFGGLGLGLAIAKAIVDLHGGTIRAASAGLGHGATFTVEIPANAATETALAQSVIDRASGTTPAPVARPCRILVVEDHVDTARMMAQLLKQFGHQVQCATTIAQAREIAARDSFDLVISDLGLPDGSGVDLMRQLRKDHGLRGIALTGYGMGQDRARTAEAGFSEHLVKPVDFDQLLAAITRVASN